MAKPSSVAQMDPTFEKRLRDLRAHAAEEGAARPLGNQVRWFRPAGWEGDPFDPAGFGPPFAPASAADDFKKAVEDPAKPGTVSDVIAVTVMVDYLAALERAFRARHTLRRPRAYAHAAARAAGHGSAKGVIEGVGLEYVRGLLARGKKVG